MGKKHNIIKWTARILAALIIIFGLPFYFGYGNPLPFINPDYTLWDNTWLTVFPLMFIGLALGWKFEIIGGLFVTIPIFIGYIIGIIARQGFSIHMAIPFLVGVLYLTSGLLTNYKQREGNQ
ncbi:hypothetical protein JXL83_04925 [candidate division WOR-3 bacterium]|nr:hypothetical protein [candidate division WOR-3 bacterium]